VLGFTVKARDRIERSGLGVPIDLVYLDLGGTVLELIAYEGAAADPAPQTEHLGYRMIALEVDDMQKTADYLRTKGVDIVWGPKVRETYSRAEICDQTATTSSFGSGWGNPMRNERAGDPLSCRQMSPILPPDVADPDAVARMPVRTHRKLRFAGDSPQEGSGFELLVPLGHLPQTRPSTSPGRVIHRHRDSPTARGSSLVPKKASAAVLVHG
jgi:hypothetical protein